ncbi:MAG: hypothetical protein DRO73_11430, partial [Candidatus Thorarchaeota archaeon]
TYVRSICDMTRRGDINRVAEAIRGYWTDKRAHPWHRIVKELSEKGPRVLEKNELEETAALLRDAVFAALDMLSLSVALNLTTRELLDIVLKEKSWRNGRREARAYCAQLAAELIAKGKLDYLVPSALERDGFGYLVPGLLQAQLDQLQSARPKLKDGAYDLSALHRSVLGRLLLRDFEVTGRALPEDDPRVKDLLEGFEHLVLEKELEQTERAVRPSDTAQVTLNGEIVEDTKPPETPEAERVEEKTPEVQLPLTEYIAPAEDLKKAKKASAKKRATKKGSAKKKTTKKSKTRARRKKKNA